MKITPFYQSAFGVGERVDDDERIFVYLSLTARLISPISNLVTTTYKISLSVLLTPP